LTAPDVIMSHHEHYLNRVTHYDENLFRILPQAELFFSTCLSFIPHHRIAIMELGSGTGYFTTFMLGQNPDYQITCIDKSPEMLEMARRKKELSGCTFIEGDITTGLPEGTFDGVVTTLTLHHIPDNSREKLIREIYQKLNPEGCFICGDVFKPEQDWIESIYRSRWKNHMRETGMPEDQIRETVSGRENAWPFLDTMHGFYRKIKNAGFKRILVPFTYDMSGVMIGWK